MPRSRNLSIDAGFDEHMHFFGELLNQFVRVATPFFFTAAGYFFAASLARGAATLPLAARLIKRLAVFFLFWSLVYILLPLDIWLRSSDTTYTAAVSASLARALTFKFLLTGGRVHLCFLPALACGLALLAVAVRVRCERELFIGAAILYAVGLLAGAYKATPIGFDLGVGTRDGPFISALFVATGYWLYRRQFSCSLRQAFAWIALGLGLRVAEVFWITSHSPIQPSEIEYLLGTYPFAVGIFLVLLNSEALGKVRWMVWVSRYSAGIYCAHMLFVDYFKVRPLAVADPLWEIARPLLVLALTVWLVLSLSKIPALKSVVT